MTTADKIFEAIRQDPANATFTAQGWDPLYHIEPDATILIASQAPGRKAQTTKTYWNDPSGDRLRTWMGVTKDQFYHSGKIAVLPLDFTTREKASPEICRRVKISPQNGIRPC